MLLCSVDVNYEGIASLVPMNEFVGAALYSIDVNDDGFDSLYPVNAFFGVIVCSIDVTWYCFTLYSICIQVLHLLCAQLM